MAPARSFGWAALVLWLAGCASAPAVPSTPIPPARADLVPRDTAGTAASLPPVPSVRGRLALRVVYPPAGALVRARDSSFLLGSAGTGDARLTINGEPVPVWPNGAWLAWVPLPSDSLMRFRIEARTDSASVVLDHAVRRADYRPPPPSESVWIDTTSLTPRGSLWWPRDEYLALAVRASEGAEVRLRLPGGTIVPFTPALAQEPVADAVRAFDHDVAGLATPLVRERYAGVLRGRAVGPDPGPLFPAPAATLATGPATAPTGGGSAPWNPPAPVLLTPDSGWAIVEAIRGGDTARARWPLQLALLDSVPPVAELDDDPSRLGTTDSLIAGRAIPEGTYHWFFPTGTRVPVSGRANADLRLRLSSSALAWVAMAEARQAEEAVVTPAVVGSVTLTPRPGRVTARIPLSRRVPFQVSEDDRSLVVRFYGAVGDVNWIRHGVVDPMVRRVAWSQASGDEVTLTFQLERPVWGYRARWEGGDLLFDIRRPPAIQQGNPLRDRVIAVDAGHPPAGATGPTGLRESEANLGIALELRRLLEAAGANVVMTRLEEKPLDLWPRVSLAEAAGAELLISVHNNALPDGINPLTNHGTSVYYNHPRSVPLARAIQEQLLRRLGLRDLGIGRGDLALVRATWMPAVLTEGLFIILPDQEAALRTEEGRRLYALAIVDGIRAFLRERSREG